MTTANSHTPIDVQENFSSHLKLFLTLIACVIGALFLSQQFPELAKWPKIWIVPIKDWVSVFFDWLANELDFGLFTFRDITRGFSWVLEQCLYVAEVVLYRGLKNIDWLLPIPWPVAIIGVGLLSHWVSGWRLAIFSMVCALYLVFFNLWEDSMKTFSLVAIAVPFAAINGLILGIASTRNARVEAFLKVIFDFMQATPHMAYLAPVIVLYGAGSKAAMIATVIFATPIMARVTILGLRTVPASVIDAAVMSGCTPRQLLWKAEIPAAQNTLMVGLNQVIMQTLAMAVIAALVGASGLGQKLLFSLNQLRIGAATEQGIAIVFLAIVLDRISQAAAKRPPGRHVPDIFWQRHIHMIIFLVSLIIFTLLAPFFPNLAVLSKQNTITFGPEITQGVRWFSANFYPYIEPFRNWMTVSVLLNVRYFYLILPWLIPIALITYLSFRFGGLKLIALNTGLGLFILISGFWMPAMMTLYIVSIAVVICCAMGIPLGIWSAHNPKVARVVLTICDTLQTFPSFIYLIPVVMILKVGDLANIAAILGFATVPAIRYTYLGLSQIAPNTLDAATVSGCTKWQKLWKVELPMAIPQIMLGVNQTILMALFMTTITALIGSKGLGQEIYKALSSADTGRGLLAGLSIAFIGIIADRLIAAWAKKRKAKMGIKD